MCVASPPISDSRLTPSSISRVASASMCMAAACMRCVAIRSAFAACSTMLGREAGEVARARRAGPAHDGMRVAAEPLEDCPQQIRPGRQAVARPQHPAHRLAAEPGPAALVRDWEPPAADTMALPGEVRPADAARSDDDDAAVAPGMRTNAGGMGVRRAHQAGKGMRMRYHLAIPGEVADAGQRQAGDDRLPGARNAGLLQALIGGPQDLGKRRGKTEADIGGPRARPPPAPCRRDRSGAPGTRYRRHPLQEAAHSSPRGILAFTGPG